MSFFNAFQITALFSGFPFIIGWLFTQEFPGSTALKWLSVAAYIVYFFGVTGCVGKAIEESK